MLGAARIRRLESSIRSLQQGIKVARATLDADDVVVSRFRRGKEVYMERIANATESIEAFFARYTRYLTEGDLEGLANIYNYPALAVTAMGCQAITEPQQTRDFFRQGQQFYRSRGIQGVRARDIVTDIEVPGIWVGRLILENLDASGSPVGQERNAYQVVTVADGTRRIAVTTPLDAYNPDQKSGVEL